MGATVSRCEEEPHREVQGEGGPFMSGEYVSSKGEERLKYFKKEPDQDEQGGEGEVDEGDSGEDEDTEEHRPEIKVASTPYDVRFPGMNQARACYTRYNEFYKCKANKDESDPECAFYARAYRSLCPGEWVESWNEARDAGTWFGKY